MSSYSAASTQPDRRRRRAAGGLTNGVNGNQVGSIRCSGRWPTTAGRPRPWPSWPAARPSTRATTPSSPSTRPPACQFTTDQRGFTRVVNGTVDIGAFEDQVVVTTPANAQATTAGSVATVDLGSFADSAINAGNSTVVVDFGDGSPTMTLLNVAPGSLGSVTHTFTSNGTYTVTVTATDQFSDANLGTLAVVVSTPTAISVSASSAAPAFGQPETLTATVTTPSGDPIPTSSDGMVTFYDGTTVLGSATLSGSPATATLTIPAGLAVGSHTITASYSGDVNFRPASSGVESTSAQSVVPATGLNEPYGVAVDGSGDVFIADIGNNQVVEVKADGTQTTVGSGLNEPYGVAVDGSGDVFIADTGNNRVVEVKADGTQTTVGSGLNLPFGVAVDGSGDVFIADSGNNRVVEVNADGIETTVASGLNEPVGVAVDGTGDVFIADSGNNRVVEVNADGIQTTVASGLNRTPWRGGGRDSGDVFIADTGQQPGGGGEVRRHPEPLGSGLSGPAGVAVDGSGDLLHRRHSGNSRVVKVTAGVPVTRQPGHADGQRQPREHHLRHGAFQQPAQRHRDLDRRRKSGDRRGDLHLHHRRGDRLGHRHRPERSGHLHAQRQHRLHHGLYNSDHQRRPGRHDHRAVFLDESHGVRPGGHLHGHGRQRCAIGRAAHRLGHVFRRRDDARQCAAQRRGRFPCGHNSYRRLRLDHCGLQRRSQLRREPLDGAQPDRRAGWYDHRGR